MNADLKYNNDENDAMFGNKRRFKAISKSKPSKGPCDAKVDDQVKERKNDSNLFILWYICSFMSSRQRVYAKDFWNYFSLDLT